MPMRESVAFSVALLGCQQQEVAMPKYSGMDALRDIGKNGHHVRVIVVTAAIEKKELVEVLQLGARGAIVRYIAPTAVFAEERSTNPHRFNGGRNQGGRC
jgi:DNA-binding NarL/FixJ family response regulator